MSGRVRSRSKSKHRKVDPGSKQHVGVSTSILDDLDYHMCIVLEILLSYQPTYRYCDKIFSADKGKETVNQEDSIFLVPVEIQSMSSLSC